MRTINISILANILANLHTNINGLTMFSQWKLRTAALVKLLLKLNTSQVHFLTTLTIPSNHKLETTLLSTVLQIFSESLLLHPFQKYTQNVIIKIFYNCYRQTKMCCFALVDPLTE